MIFKGDLFLRMCDGISDLVRRHRVTAIPAPAPRGRGPVEIEHTHETVEVTSLFGLALQPIIEATRHSLLAGLVFKQFRALPREQRIADRLVVHLRRDVECEESIFVPFVGRAELVQLAEDAIPFTAIDGIAKKETQRPVTAAPLHGQNCRFRAGLTDLAITTSL